MAVNENYTKNLFAGELKKMLRTMPLDKVRVSDLCARCGADRRTFYYHFEDKYDLVAWIYMRDYEEALAAEGGAYTLQHVVNLIERLDRHRDFYKAVYADTSQNSVRKYMYQYYYTLGTEAIKAHLGIDELTDEMDYAVRMQFYAAFGLTVEWLFGRVDYSIEEFARLQYHFMPQDLKDAYGIEGDY